jgi:hypothetical protein
VVMVLLPLAGQHSGRVRSDSAASATKSISCTRAVQLTFIPLCAG